MSIIIPLFIGACVGAAVGWFVGKIILVLRYRRNKRKASPNENERKLT